MPGTVRCRLGSPRHWNDQLRTHRRLRPMNDRYEQHRDSSGDSPLRPAAFPIGSTESRGLARAEVQRRRRLAVEKACVVIGGGLSRQPIDLLTVIPPDFVEYYLATDESIIRAVYRHWEGPKERGLTIFVEQFVPDGTWYKGVCGVKTFAEVQRLPRIEPSAIERLRAANDCA